eukprot:scaffold6880_cov110-Isochrysis_galbana.AAC.22
MRFAWCLRPHTIHDDPPSLAVERHRRDPIPSVSTKDESKQAHFPSTWRRGKKGTRHKGAGKGAYTSSFEGGGSARGGLPTPLFSGA